MECWCRLCGVNIGEGDRKKSKNSDVFKKWIRRAFKFCPSDDPPLFPNFVCDNCRRKLSHWYKDAVQNNKNATLRITTHKDFLLPAELELEKDKENQDLFNRADELAKEHGFQKWSPDTGDVFYLTFNPSTMAVERCITLLKNREWKLTIKGKEQKQCLLTPLNGIPAIISTEHLAKLFTAAVAELCVGNPDFPCLMKRKERFGKGKGNIQASVEEGHYVFRGKEYSQTIRKHSCTFLPDINSQCPECNIYRTDLGSAASYERKKVDSSSSDRASSSSHVPHGNMNKDEIIEKLENVQKEKRNLMRRNEVLKTQMAHLVKTENRFFRRRCCEYEYNSGQAFWWSGQVVDWKQPTKVALGITKGSSRMCKKELKNNALASCCVTLVYCPAQQISSCI